MWRNVSVNVVANSNWSCLLISAHKVHWRVQPTDARWSGRFKMHGALRALHVSLNNATTRIVCKCLKRNNGQLITFQIWIEWRYLVWGATHEAILKASSEAKNTDLKIVLEKIWDNFPHVQLIKLSRVSQVVWQAKVNGDVRHSKHLSLLKKMFALTAFALSWIVETIFDNVSTAKLPWLKAA